MENIEVKEFKLRNHTIPLNVSPEELFMPNTVTRLFSKAITINQGDTVFDIGSGVGPLAIWAALEPSRNVYAVEIVQKQYELLKRNMYLNKVENKVKPCQGSLFDPIPEGIKADVIIGDVSGISEGPSKVLGWYPQDIPTGGRNGTDVIIPLLEKAGDFLKENGRLYFPIGSLSDYEEIERIAESKFEKLLVKESPNFPLDKTQLLKLINDETPGKYTIRKNGSRWVWDGWIYEATLPRRI